MCLILHNPLGTKYKERELRNAHRTNDDGVGIMWVEDGKVQTYHGMINEDEFVKIINEFKGVPHTVHLRFATNGPPSTELCHPFKASPDDADQAVWMMHNGVLFKYGQMAERHESDTQIFARCVAKDMSDYAEGTDLLLNDEYIAYLTAEISGDKMIFLRDDGTVVVLNESRWYTDKETGILYSNTYSVADRPRYGSYVSSSYGSSLAAASSSSSKSAKESAKAFGYDEDDDTFPGLSEADYDWYFSQGDDADDEDPTVDVPEAGEYLLYFKFVDNNENGSGHFELCTEEESDIDMDAAEYFTTWNEANAEERALLPKPPSMEELVKFKVAERISVHATEEYVDDAEASEDAQAGAEFTNPDNPGEFDVVWDDTRPMQRVNDDDPEFDDIY